MTTLIGIFPTIIPNCNGASEESYGYRLTFIDGSERPATDAEVLQASIVMQKTNARAWLTAINGRAYEHAGNSEDFDDVIIAIRTGARNMINNWAIEAGLAPRVSAAEAKAAFATAAAPFDLIDKAKQGKVLMVAQIEALTDVASATAYAVTDSTAASLWAAANPAVTPTLGELLTAYPIRV